MDDTALIERRKYERMWTFAEYRDDHATRHADDALALLKPTAGDSIIDFGAGAGYASRRLQEGGLQVLAIDIAGNAMAPEIAARIPLLIGNMWDIPVTLVADWGFCCDVMEHIPTDRVDDVLRFVHASTRGATYFNISLRTDGCGRLIGDALHLTVRPLDWWRETLSAYWSDIRIIDHDPGESVELVAAGRRNRAASAAAGDAGSITRPELRELIRSETREAVTELLSTPPASQRQLNYERMAYVSAAADSARYMIERMQGAVDRVMAHAVREHALAQCEVTGLVMEFGVFDGQSLSHIASRTGQDVHGFDSFEGLPEDWTHFQKKGRFSRGGAPPACEGPRTHLHKGWFDEVLPGFLREHAGPARFIHIDCDLYSSTQTVLTALEDRIVPGTVIVFDEYLNYPGWQQHEHKAFAEFLTRTGRSYRYLGFASSEFAVSVQMSS